MAVAKTIIGPLGQSENPAAATAGFSFRLVVLLISVKPFANIVADYTCCDRN